MPDILKIKRGNRADLPTLAQGEMAYTLDTKELHIGGNSGNDLLPSPNYEYVNVVLNGADNTGAADATSIIITSIAQAKAQKKGLYIPYGTYKISATIDMSDVCAVQSDNATLSFAATGTAVQIVANPGSNKSFNQFMGHLYITKPVVNWQDESRGFFLQNVTNSEFHVSVSGFTYGYYIMGNNTGCAYNNFFPVLMSNNKYACFLTSANSGGWPNQNTFFGGRYMTTMSGGGSYIRLDDSQYSCNGNVWIHPCFESAQADYLLLELRGNHNAVIEPRCENPNADTLVDIGGSDNAVYALSSPYFTYLEDGTGTVKITGTRATYLGTDRTYKKGIQPNIWEVYSYTQAAGKFISTYAGPGLVAQNKYHNAYPIYQGLDKDNAVTFSVSAQRGVEKMAGRTMDWGATAVPTTGTYVQGDVVWVKNPVAGGNMGYVCVASGTPGTWKTFGAIQA